MNARQLEVFRAIMREGTLTAAANVLGVSQPAVSKVLHHLEDQLGYALFDRSGAKLTATAEARLLFDDADRVFRELEVLKDLAARIGERKAGLLRIGASLPIVHSVLPRALDLFQIDHPGVKVHLHGFPAREIAEALHGGDIDLGLTLTPILTPTVRSRVLKDVPVVVLARADDTISRKKRSTATDLEHRKLISYGSHSEIGAQLDAVFRENGLTRDVAIQVASSVTAGPLVEEGLGLALVDGLAEHARDLVKLPFEPACIMPLVVSFDSARPVPRLAEPFLTAFESVL